MSRVTCHMSRVTCHMSRVMCHFLFFIFFYLIFFPDKVVELIGGGSVINGATPSSFPYGLKMMSKNTLSELQPDSASYGYFLEDQAHKNPNIPANIY